jgi:hypothetical protein
LKIGLSSAWKQFSGWTDAQLSAISLSNIAYQARSAISPIKLAQQYRLSSSLSNIAYQARSSTLIGHYPSQL